MKTKVVVKIIKMIIQISLFKKLIYPFSLSNFKTRCL